MNAPRSVLAAGLLGSLLPSLAWTQDLRLTVDSVTMTAVRLTIEWAADPSTAPVTLRTTLVGGRANNNAPQGSLLPPATPLPANTPMHVEVTREQSNTRSALPSVKELDATVEVEPSYLSLRIFSTKTYFRRQIIPAATTVVVSASILGDTCDLRTKNRRCRVKSSTGKFWANQAEYTTPGRYNLFFDAPFVGKPDVDVDFRNAGSDVFRADEANNSPTMVTLEFVNRFGTPVRKDVRFDVRITGGREVHSP
jgi:hypothetical protein